MTARIPTRTNTDDRYFTDSFQAMPRDGYTAMFKKMLDNPLIEVRTGVDFRDVEDEIEADHIIYTGPIDEYFDHRFGKLPYRSLKFDHKTLDEERHQPVGTVNYPVARRALHADQRVQASDRPAGAGDDHHLRISIGRGRSLLSDPARRRTRRCSSATRRSPTRPKA